MILYYIKMKTVNIVPDNRVCVKVCVQWEWNLYF